MCFINQYIQQKVQYMKKRWLLAEICFHFAFCVILLSFFGRNCFLRPGAVGAVYKEYLSGVLVLAVVYSNYLALVPELFLKRRFALYAVGTVLLISSATAAEFFMVLPNIRHCIESYLSGKALTEAYQKFTFLLAVRNFAFFSFSLLLGILKSYAILDWQKNTALRNQIKNIDARDKDGNLILLKINDICYCEQVQNYSWIHTQNGEKFSRMSSLKELEELLCPDFGLRVSRRHIIMSNYITECNPCSVTLECNMEKILLPIMTAKYDEIRNVVEKKESDEQNMNVVKDITTNLKPYTLEPEKMQAPKEISDEELSDTVAVRKSDRKVQLIYNYIAEHENCTRKEIIDSLNLPKGTVERYIRQLKEDDRIRFAGTSRSGGYYIIKQSEKVND